MAACSLCVRSCYLRVGKNHHEVLFPSHDSLLKICCDKIILDELLIQSLQNTLWSGERVHAKNSAHAKRNGTMCSWQRQGVGRNQNPFTSAQPQLPLPPPNQIKITFLWGLWRPCRLHAQVAEHSAARSLFLFLASPTPLKIPLKIWTNVWMRPVPPPHPSI